jgi:hypothetical protein
MPKTHPRRQARWKGKRGAEEEREEAGKEIKIIKKNRWRRELWS